MVVIVIDHGTVRYKLDIGLCLVRLLMSRPLLAIRKNAGESALPFHTEAMSHWLFWRLHRASFT